MEYNLISLRDGGSIKTSIANELFPCSLDKAERMMVQRVNWV